MGFNKKLQHNINRNGMIQQTTLGDIRSFNELVKYQFDLEEIKKYDAATAINNHPLARRPFAIRSKMAYSGLLHELTPSKKYLLPGQLAVFGYSQPKYKEELEYYDATPLTLFLGITRTADGNVREIGLNLHYFPIFARTQILNITYQKFKPYWEKFFNEPSNKPNMIISYSALKHIMKSNMHLAFGIKMYIPVLRSNTYLVPTRLFSTAAMTEGHFSKATIQEVMRYWRKFNR